MLIYSYDGSGRELRKIIMMVLKKGVANSVKRLNYVKDYSLDDQGKISKKEQKIVMFFTDSEEKVTNLISKNKDFCRINQ